ncbi:ABC transporter ATP-binding protein [Rubeoparvulum massiliense]|uniref:ABC transporter ATP-binding protein n=1 Tax=Rubeoparvulum massiliense TaxID=1631346 RepID=UPI00065E248B|nr:ABC transporter ATP-binding protein [Rubeoparvulum massiliense]
MSENDVIRLERVYKSFGKKDVITACTLSIEGGRIVGILGPSGAGKTTLIRMIVGLERPTQGRVAVFGTPMPNLPLMQEIGYMAQSDALYQELSAWENLQFYAALYQIPKGLRKDRIREVMEWVGLQGELKKLVGHYSGGMKRRLSLAISLLHHPKLLILDEPTVGIDPVLRRAIWQKLQQLRDAGTTILITTHVMDEAEYCDELALLREGRLLVYGTLQQLKESTGSFNVEDVFLHYEECMQGGEV